ncbi:MAG: hypothetical protein HY717_23900 [Planctomycetes bacterium]|nr:hypothetical protein [Planctomycetota bacterium]
MFEVARDQTGPMIKQLSFFLPNRVGALLGVVRKLEEKNVHICAVSILDSADHAVIRMVVDRPSVAREALIAEGHEVFETELLGVELSPKKNLGIKNVLATLLLAEINIHYIYSLIVQSNDRPILAFHVDEVATAVKALQKHGLTLVGQDEIQWDQEN